MCTGLSWNTTSGETGVQNKALGQTSGDVRTFHTLQPSHFILASQTLLTHFNSTPHRIEDPTLSPSPSVSLAMGQHPLA